MNSHIRAGRFRGGGEIGDAGSRIAKRTMHREYNIIRKIKPYNSSTLVNYRLFR